MIADCSWWVIFVSSISFIPAGGQGEEGLGILNVSLYLLTNPALGHMNAWSVSSYING
jgi:hypothetical protein